ncbi:hypothetical protein J2W70_003756 [Pseudomonas koreensis]|nr:hypothetical protein [Pseudomonas koreensis]
MFTSNPQRPEKQTRVETRSRRKGIKAKKLKALCLSAFLK